MIRFSDCCRALLVITLAACATKTVGAVSDESAETEAVPSADPAAPSDKDLTEWTPPKPHDTSVKECAANAVVRPGASQDEIFDSVEDERTCLEDANGYLDAPVPLPAYRAAADKLCSGLAPRAANGAIGLLLNEQCLRDFEKLLARQVDEMAGELNPVFAGMHATCYDAYKASTKASSNGQGDASALAACVQKDLEEVVKTALPDADVDTYLSPLTKGGAIHGVCKALADAKKLTPRTMTVCEVFAMQDIYSAVRSGAYTQK